MCSQSLAWAPQEPLLSPHLTAAEWIFLGRELRTGLRLLRREEMRRAARRALDEIGCAVEAQTPLGELAPPQRKQVQLARALHGKPRLILLDEPTAALGAGESERLFTVLRARRAAGSGVLYVTHRLDEVRSLADRVTVLRDGRRISTGIVEETDTAALIRDMVGRDLPKRVREQRALGSAILSLERLAVGHIEEVSLHVRSGEIVGLAGLVGAGRSEILETAAGLRAPRQGRRWCAAEPFFVPEDRGSKGLVPTFGVRENVFLPAPHWRLDAAEERREVAHWIDELGIRCRGAEAPIGSLSGGNQQKLLLARALRHRPRLLLLDEPTAGVDVGAKADIHAIILRLAAKGTAVLLASSDLVELLNLCDRIIALRRGRIAGEVGGDEASEARLGELITGAGQFAAA